MGTRGAFGFRIDGQDKVGYNQFDSYPSGKGVDILEFIRDNEIQDIVAAARRIIMVSDEVKPTPEQIEECKAFTDLSVSEQSTSDWYCLTRNAHGYLEPYTKGGLRYMLDSHEFLADSLFCEWAYIINCDAGTLEVYRGFNKKPSALGRYGKLQEKPWKNERTGEMVVPEYYGVVLVAEEPLKTLQQQLRLVGAGDLVKPEVREAKQEAIIEKITSGWQKTADDQYEAAQRVEKEEAEHKAKLAKIGVKEAPKPRKKARRRA